MINCEGIDKSNILYLDEVDSTNSHAHEWAKKGDYPPGIAIIAKTQTAGKGQRGRKWVHQTGKDLAMSLILNHDDSDPSCLPYLSMSVGLALAKLVRHYLPNSDIKAKWVNDIYVNRQKIAGILIENVWQGNIWKSSIIGIGLNINSTEWELDNTPTSLKILTQEDIDIEATTHNLLRYLKESLNNCIENKDAILADYNDILFQKGELIHYRTADEQVMSGSVKGVNAYGELLVETDGIVHSYSYGTIQQLQ